MGFVKIDAVEVTIFLMADKKFCHFMSYLVKIQYRRHRH
jgi:hypothetical protein